MVLALMTVCFGADRARAQGALGGQFTLPFETRWGSAVLPAADYTLMLDHKGAIDVVDISRGQVKVAMVLCIAHDNRSYNSSHSAITIVRHGNKGTVLSLNLPQLGEIYFFSLPKGERVFAQNSPKREMVLAQAPELIQRIPVVREVSLPRDSNGAGQHPAPPRGREIWNARIIRMRTQVKLYIQQGVSAGPASLASSGYVRNLISGERGAVMQREMRNEKSRV